MTKKNENFNKSKFFWLDEPDKFSSLYKTKNILLLPNKIFLNQRIKIIKSFLKKEINTTALDIGCGSGEFTYILKDPPCVFIFSALYIFPPKLLKKVIKEVKDQ